ncbi:MAG: flagellar filament capping protein FliD, partial [Planctomycetes bacterium]|nr:flagellar filament capping protein FliD [Planctomycetota bacterium]
TQVAVAATLKLEFDEEECRAAFAEDPDAAAELFTKAEVGIGDWLGDRLERLAGSSNSTVQYRVDAMQSQKKLLENRAEHLQELLDAKEQRLYNQFYAMEQALASMQTQQTALASLSSSLSQISSAKK